MVHYVILRWVVHVDLALIVVSVDVGNCHRTYRLAVNLFLSHVEVTVFVIRHLSEEIQQMWGSNLLHCRRLLVHVLSGACLMLLVVMK